jgi:hypothetical protein
MVAALAIAVAVAWPAAAQESGSEAAPAGEAPATDDAAPAAEAGEGEPAEATPADGEPADEEQVRASTPLPDSGAQPFKIRQAPTRAIRASEIKTRTDNLADLISTSEDRLRQLSKRVLSGKVGRAGAVVLYHNEMGTSFKLIRAVFALDGAPIFSQVDESGELGARSEIELFNGSIVPGSHKLSVSLEYRGHGYGIFSYLKGYRFKVRSTYGFKVGEDKVANVRIVGYEKGDQNTPLEERPDVRYVERVESFGAAAAAE